MRVISLIQRPEGHVVTLDGDQYAFMPPDWSCEVSHPQHLARFAAVVEGYRLDAVPASRPAVSGERVSKRGGRSAAGRGASRAPSLLDGT